LICIPAEDEEIRFAQQPGEVIVQRVVGNHVRVVAVPVSGNVDRKNHPSHMISLCGVKRKVQAPLDRTSRAEWLES
jgi:hypothetical protein